ncbi:DUF4261 domain-containing protein [soil metagenome]
MPKGLITQTAVVLFEKQVTIDDLTPLLGNFSLVGEMPSAEHWEFGGPSVTISYRPEVNGYATVDVVEQSWPDGMGDPKNEVTLFGAWSMGWFGPYTFPWSLKRAVQQAWSWPGAAETVGRHQAFVRVRTSYIFGADKEAKVLPQDYVSLPELAFVTSLAEAVLAHPDALCYFNPNGEALFTQDALRDSQAFAALHALPPLDTYANVRLFNIDPTWLLMDTVGNWQLDMPDHEMAFPRDFCQPQEVGQWLRNASLYVFNAGDQVIKDGDTMEGPGDRRWQARAFKNGLCTPPREVLRWLPCDVAAIPAFLTEEKSEEA